ncbi:MAG: Thioredoxin [candidate division TM6 bacterium GW2011_GWE2_41_16]|nr:MAG: Thioredoxin [candidate division TM6 bacterium GW2011_GWE2_41_16]
MVIIITQDNFEKEIAQATKPVVLDIYATWCGPCQQMKPVFEKLAQEMGDQYIFASINVDEARELAIRYGVTSIPTFVFVKGGQIKGKEVGFIGKDSLKEKIKTYLG